MLTHLNIFLEFQKIGRENNFKKSVNCKNSAYSKVPKFSDVRKLCFNLPKIQTKRPNSWVICQKDANGIANSKNPDQTAPLEAV